MNNSLIQQQQNFEAQIRPYQQDLKNFSLWLTRDPHIAQDVVQETLLRAWKSFDKLENPKALKGWLFTICRRENARRFERIQPKFSEIEFDAIEEKNQDYDTSVEAFVLRQTLPKLKKEYLKPLLMQVVLGQTQKEIGKELNLSVAGVGTRLFRAKKQLESLLTAA